MLLLSAAAPGTSLSDTLSGIGLLVGAIAGAMVAVMGASDRLASRRNAKIRRQNKRMDIQADQIEWHHRRQHDLLVALAAAGVAVPREHEDYPKDDDLDEDKP